MFVGRKYYHYRKETGTYEAVKFSYYNTLKNAARILAGALLFANIFLFCFFHTETPKSKRLKEEVAILEKSFSHLEGEMENMIDDLEALQYKDDYVYRYVLQVKPIDGNYRNFGTGGAEMYNNFRMYQHANLLVKTNKRLDKIRRKLGLQSKSFDEIEHAIREKQDLHAALPAIQPIPNGYLKRISSGYGMRKDPVTKRRRFHPGIDLSAPSGTPVYASGEGVIKEVKYSRVGYGNRILIDHGHGYSTLYGHLREFTVLEGEKVVRGQLIGYVGNTGKSTASHLHYEVWLNNVKINPYGLLNRKMEENEYFKVIEKANNRKVKKI